MSSARTASWPVEPSVAPPRVVEPPGELLSDRDHEVVERHLVGVTDDNARAVLAGLLHAARTTYAGLVLLPHGPEDRGIELLDADGPLEVERPTLIEALNAWWRNY